MILVICDGIIGWVTILGGPGENCGPQCLSRIGFELEHCVFCGVDIRDNIGRLVDGILIDDATHINKGLEIVRDIHNEVVGVAVIAGCARICIRVQIEKSGDGRFRQRS